MHNVFYYEKPFDYTKCTSNKDSGDFKTVSIS